MDREKAKAAKDFVIAYGITGNLADDLNSHHIADVELCIRDALQFIIDGGDDWSAIIPRNAHEAYKDVVPETIIFGDKSYLIPFTYFARGHANMITAHTRGNDTEKQNDNQN